MQQFSIAQESELFCPICHEPGHCDWHSVERWEGTQRFPHLKSVLKRHDVPEGIYELLLKKYPNPESCFPGAVLISWDLPPTEAPLFEGATVETSSMGKGYMLFHSTGKQFLEKYYRFIRAQLNSQQKIQSIINVLRSAKTTNTKPRILMPRMHDGPDAKSTVAPIAASDENVPLDDLMQNLI